SDVFVIENDEGLSPQHPYLSARFLLGMLEKAGERVGDGCEPQAIPAVKDRPWELMIGATVEGLVSGSERPIFIGRSHPKPVAVRGRVKRRGRQRPPFGCAYFRVRKIAFA